MHTYIVGTRKIVLAVIIVRLYRVIYFIILMKRFRCSFPFYSLVRDSAIHRKCLFVLKNASLVTGFGKSELHVWSMR